MLTILIFYFYADNLKVSTIVSINFFVGKMVQILNVQEGWGAFFEGEGRGLEVTENMHFYF